MIILEARIWFNENINEKVRAVELVSKLLKEEAERALMEERARLEEERNLLARQMIEEEQTLNQNLNDEIRRRGFIFATIRAIPIPSKLPLIRWKT